jgi:hypothetical protein
MASTYFLHPRARLPSLAARSCSTFISIPGFWTYSYCVSNVSLSNLKSTCRNPQRPSFWTRLSKSTWLWLVARTTVCSELVQIHFLTLRWSSAQLPQLLPRPPTLASFGPCPQQPPWRRRKRRQRYRRRPGGESILDDSQFTTSSTRTYSMTGFFSGT